MTSVSMFCQVLQLNSSDSHLDGTCSLERKESKCKLSYK